MLPRPTRLAFLALALFSAACSSDHPDRASSDSAPEISDGSTAHSGFVSSHACAECHQDQFDRWQGSHHDLAMQEANDQTVLGDFGDVTFEHDGRQTRFFEKEGRFWVNAQGPDGENHDYAVAYTFGADPLQQYLLEFPGGRFQCLDVAWDINAKEWFDVFPQQAVAPDDAYHWTGRFQSWNLQCADCHSTEFKKNYDPATDSYASTWEEIDVGCEACHGPGADHVRLAKEWGAGGRPGDAPSGLITELRKEESDGILNACAACHSRRTSLTSHHKIGADFEDDYRLSTLSSDLYHADGQIYAEVYVLGSFLQSKMHQRGVSCSDCHDPHSLDLWLPGDGTCLQCHSPTPPLDRFPTLQAKTYADPAHHLHPQDSEAARCVNCHMPETTYMVIDPRRDHSLRVPRPDLSVSIGTPNACNGCHTDQSAEWAAGKVRDWYGDERPAHFGTALDALRSADGEALKSLLMLPFDEDQPNIVRASAVDRLPESGQWNQMRMQAAVQLLGEEELDPNLRVSALACLMGSPPQLLTAIVPDHLDDPTRIVRIEAAHVLAGPAERELKPEQKKLFEAAFAEFEEAQRANADAPFAHLNLGVMHERRGDLAKARAAYRLALRLDPGFLPAVFNLATLLSGENKNSEAETLLREAIASFPNEGELHYSLGLLLAGSGQVEKSAEALADASRLMPSRGRVHYNLGLAYTQIGRKPEAEGALLRAHRTDVKDPDFLYALSTFYLEDGDLERAMDYCQRLCEAVPQNPGPIELREQIQKRIAAGE